MTKKYTIHWYFEPIHELWYSMFFLNFKTSLVIASPFPNVDVLRTKIDIRLSPNEETSSDEETEIITPENWIISTDNLLLVIVTEKAVFGNYRAGLEKKVYFWVLIKTAHRSRCFILNLFLFVSNWLMNN